MRVGGIQQRLLGVSPGGLARAQDFVELVGAVVIFSVELAAGFIVKLVVGPILRGNRIAINFDLFGFVFKQRSPLRQRLGQ